MSVSCINCFSFKFRKGWLKAYCSKGNILFAVKDGERDFVWDNDNGNLMRRGVNMKVLNPEKCFDFDGEETNGQM